MIYDCFLFYNELEILEIRLNELNDVVDKFVLVEATVTHTNKNKPLFFNENKKRFSKFNDKIIHIIVKDSPNVSLPWILERFQLEATVRGLGDAKPNDIILYGAVDEIPRASKLKVWSRKPGKLKVFLQKFSNFYLNYQDYTKLGWEGTVMFKYKYLKIFENIYFTRYLPHPIKIPNGGWHFSYMGGIKSIQEKMTSMAHQEYNNDKYNTPEKIKIAIYRKEDLFDWGYKYKIVNLNELPVYVREHPHKFKKFLFDQNQKSSIKTPIIYLNIKNKFRIYYRKLRRKFTTKP